MEVSGHPGPILSGPDELQTDMPISVVILYPIIVHTAIAAIVVFVNKEISYQISLPNSIVCSPIVLVVWYHPTERRPSGRQADCLRHADSEPLHSPGSYAGAFSPSPELTMNAL